MKSKWYNAVVDILKHLYIDINQLDLQDNTSRKCFINDIKNKMKTSFENQWKERLPKGQSNKNKNEEGKLRTYDSFKDTLKCEKYLSLNVDLQLKSYFTKLRLSNHILNIEKGRFSKIKRKNKDIVNSVKTNR